MVQFAKVLSRVQPSVTLAISETAKRLKNGGLDVISLSAGEPDFDTPEHIKQAAIRAINEGKTKYTPVSGIPALKQAICEKFARDNNLLFSQDQIIVGCGAKHLIFNALFACLNPGDEVIIPAPYWVSYPDMVKLTGAEPVIFLCTQDDDFKIKPQKLRKLITSKTKFFMLNSPSNPTGVAYTKAEVKEIAGVLLEHPHVLVLSDDIYESMCFDGAEFATIASVEPKLADRVITINGVSKSYAMTGWRIGYAAANVDIIKAMSKVQSQSTSNPCSISQAAAVEALTGPQGFISENNKLFQRRRDLVVSMLNNIDNMNCHKPDGAFYAFANCEAFFGRKRPDGKIISGSVDFADYLLSEALVAVVPGAAFGAEGFFRVSYATSDDLLTKACTRIAEACSKLKE